MSLPSRFPYDVFLTALSFLFAGALTSLGIAVAIIGSGVRNALLGGAVVGLAIAGMHFLGMQALQVPGRVILGPRSCLCRDRVCGGLWDGGDGGEPPQRRPHDGRSRAVALFRRHSVLHFTAMGAIEIVPDPTRSVTPFALSPTVLALCVAAVTAVVLAIGAAGSIVDQRMGEKNELSKPPCKICIRACVCSTTTSK